MSQDGTRRVLGYMPATVSAVGLLVSTGSASAEAFELIERATRPNLALLAAGAVATLAPAWWFGRTYIMHKVMRVVRTAGTWRKGDLSARTLMNGRDGEIEAIARAFGLLADGLAARERDKADHQRELLLNEFCTNAVQYAALSSETGRVDDGGPPVVAPTRAGFDSRLCPRRSPRRGAGLLPPGGHRLHHPSTSGQARRRGPIAPAITGGQLRLRRSDGRRRRQARLRARR